MRATVYNATVTADSERMNVNVWAFGKREAIAHLLERFPDVSVHAMTRTSSDDPALAGTVLVIR
jgi:hypothetical protein